MLAGWVVTAPQDLDPADHRRFFEECHKFLVGLYGKRNNIQSVVHKDEAQAHLHFIFIPVVEDTKRGGDNEKVCAKELLTKEHLRTFHPNLQKHLNDAGINARVHTGITAAQGGNSTVKQLKLNRKRDIERERDNQKGVFLR